MKKPGCGQKTSRMSGIRDLECKEQAVPSLPESQRMLDGVAHAGGLGTLPGEHVSRPRGQTG